MANDEKPRAQDARPDEAVVPVAAEEVVVAKRQTERGRVQVTKRVRETEARVHEPLLQEEVQVERVPVDRVVERAPEVRYEGDVLVIPVLEEVPVVTKQLVLREELRITKHVRASPHEEQVTLRAEEVEVERVKPQSKGNT